MSRVKLDFVDLLYAVPVAALATRVGETHLEHVGASAWGDMLLALIALTLGWVGHHTNRRRKQTEAPDPPKVLDKTFTEGPFWQFWVEVLVIGAYFALSTRLSLPGQSGGNNGQLQWKAWWIVGLFALYLLWDCIDITIARRKQAACKKPPARADQAEKYKKWAERAEQGRIVTALFLVVFVGVRYSVPAGPYRTWPFDVTCIILLYGYRFSQQEWIRASDIRDSPKRRGIVLAIGVLIALGFSGPLNALFSVRREAVVIAGEAVIIGPLQPSHGPATGGTTVVVTGKYFEPGKTTFRVGKADAIGVRCWSERRCTFVTSAGPVGVADVFATLHTSGAISSKSSKAAHFTYLEVKREDVQVELTPYGRTVLRRRLGPRCRNDDLYGRVVAGPSSALTVLAYASTSCRRLRVRVTPDLGAVYYLPARWH